jgi:hypothetical protein
MLSITLKENDIFHNEIQFMGCDLGSQAVGVSCTIFSGNDAISPGAQVAHSVASHPNYSNALQRQVLCEYI